MNKINDGGPAFPSDKACDSWQCRKPSAGMSLRDWFAGQATEEDLQDILAKCYGCGELPSRAEARMMFADDMLKARESSNTP